MIIRTAARARYKYSMERYSNLLQPPRSQGVAESSGDAAASAETQTEPIRGDELQLLSKNESLQGRLEQAEQAMRAMSVKHEQEVFRLKDSHFEELTQAQARCPLPDLSHCPCMQLQPQL